MSGDSDVAASVASGTGFFGVPLETSPSFGKPRGIVTRFLIFSSPRSDRYSMLQQFEYIGPPNLASYACTSWRVVAKFSLHVKNVNRKPGVVRNSDYVVRVVDIQLELMHLVDSARARL